MIKVIKNDTVKGTLREKTRGVRQNKISRQQNGTFITCAKFLEIAP